MSDGDMNSTEIIADFADWKEFLFCGIVTSMFGLFGIVNNIITIFLIWKSKKLHTCCFILVGGHACFCCIMAIGFTTLGIHYLGLGFRFLTAVYTRMGCTMLYMIMTFSSPPSSALSFLIAVERFVAIAFPAAYRNHDQRLTKAALALAVTVGALCSIIAVVTVPEPWDALTKCYSMYAGFDSDYSVFFANFNLAFSILALLSYGAMYIPIRMKSRTPQNSEPLEINQFMKNQMKLLPMVNALAIAYGLVGVGPPLMAAIFSTLAGRQYLHRNSLYIMVLKSALPSLDFCVLTWKCREFRRTLESLFGVKSNQVENVGTSRT